MRFSSGAGSRSTTALGSGGVPDYPMQWRTRCVYSYRRGAAGSEAVVGDSSCGVCYRRRRAELLLTGGTNKLNLRGCRVEM